MIVQAEEMMKAVKVAIDMNRADEPLFAEGDRDTLSLEEIIYSKLTDAVKIVELEAPHIMLESGHDLIGLYEESNVFIKTNGKGFIVLPDDFLRLVAFRMSDWERTVFEAISENDPKYLLQSSKYPGIYGSPQKPVVAIVRRSEGKVLEFYSCSSTNVSISQATYIPIPKIDDNGGIDVSEDCYKAAVYRAASLVLASVGDQLSTTMLEISKSLLLS